MRRPPSRPAARRLLAAALVALAAALASAAAEAAEPETSTEPPVPSSAARIDPARALADLAAGESGGGARAELAGPPARLPAEWEDETTRAAYLAAVRDYYDYRRSGLHHRRGVFAWQLVSSKVIFVVVVLLVLSGVYFSGVQFHLTLAAWKAAAARAAKGEAAVGPGPDALGGELKAGLDQVEVRSPVLGVIILALSFLFFYLYIVHVHPIREIL